jgi:uncharacterized protein (TIGR02300 family)
LVKTDWGTKRECGGCGARFYDLGRTPIICPKCEETFTPESAKLTRAEARAKAKLEAEEKSKAEDAKAAAASASSGASSGDSGGASSGDSGGASSGDSGGDSGDDTESALLKAAGINKDSDDDSSDSEKEEEDAGLIEGGFDVEGGNDLSNVVDAPVATKPEDT